MRRSAAPALQPQFPRGEPERLVRRGDDDAAGLQMRGEKTREDRLRALVEGGRRLVENPDRARATSSRAIAARRCWPAER